MSKFTPNFSQVPNAFIDEIMVKLPDSSVKMYLLIVRKTKGWSKEVDAISISQFMKFTGKSRPTVVDAIKYLVEAEIVLEHDTTRYGKTYSINDEIYDGFFLLLPSKKILLVKIFNHSSKKTLLPLVKIFNTQKKLSKETNQKKKSEPKKRFSFSQSLKELGAEDRLISDWLQVRKTKRASNTETALNGFMKQVEKSGLPLNTVLEICVIRSWQGFNIEWLKDLNPSELQPKQSTPAPQNLKTVKGAW